KHPHAKLEFHEYCETNIIDVDARHVIKNRYPNTKPWVVRTKDSGETSFETHGTAFNHLTEYLVHTKWKSTDGSP
ncbi:MAG: hypothetical protein Q8L63_01105, partial [Alphaproteobacteria bacterium]|nr:hypothetical protein [Alphaproteobacteria bacterium]